MNRKFGITRQVLITKRYAFKFPQTRYGFRYFCRGIIANYSEQEMGGHGFAPDPPALPPNPVLKALPWGLCNVYRTAQPFDGEMRDEWFGFFGDPKPDNLGWVDGKLMVTDYDCYPRCPQCVRRSE